CALPIWLTQHQTLPTQRFDPRQLRSQRFQIFAAFVGMLQSELCCTLGQSVLEKSEPVLETAIHRRRIKDEETHFVPQIVFVLPPDNADSALKFLSINPEFAIQRYCG